MSENHRVEDSRVRDLLAPVVMALPCSQCNFEWIAAGSELVGASGLGDWVEKLKRGFDASGDV